MQIVEGNRVDPGWRLEDLHRGRETACRERSRQEKMRQALDCLLQYPGATQELIVDAWRRGISCIPAEKYCWIVDAPRSLWEPGTNHVALANVEAALEALRGLVPEWKAQEAYEYLALYGQRKQE